MKLSAECGPVFAAAILNSYGAGAFRVFPCAAGEFELCVPVFEVTEQIMVAKGAVCTPITTGNDQEKW